MDGWEFLVQHEGMVRALCKRMARGDHSMYEALWDEAVDRVHRILELWNEELSPLIPYAIRNLKWYMWKRIVKIRQLQAKHEDEADLYYIPPELDSLDEVQSILEGLSELDRWLLWTHYALGFTYEEIGDSLGIGKGAARNRTLKALERARDGLASSSS